jgi:hypothetical protein
MIAGYDVGITFNEFREYCLNIPENEKDDAKSFFRSIVDKYAVCNDEILYRIDGTQKDVSEEDWKQENYSMIDRLFQQTLMCPECGGTNIETAEMNAYEQRDWCPECESHVWADNKLSDKEMAKLDDFVNDLCQKNKNR